MNKIIFAVFFIGLIVGGNSSPVYQEYTQTSSYDTPAPEPVPVEAAPVQQDSYAAPAPEPVPVESAPDSYAAPAPEPVPVEAAPVQQDSYAAPVQQSSLIFGDIFSLNRFSSRSI
ncbi:hypothetical protein BpHYR1_040936 [Brachionus plicatilis]|uniref:Uncharacterized protein n=1 Tax=Brachionus plicatilis TaxID=10195 RepID=A0A3M7STT2_BRAPC|nr:hypothetical protein BpHYR1_040936 [Brachionus plicatilis]